MIEIIDFSNVKVDGANVGDCIAAVANYPDRAGAILAALATYQARLIAAAVPAPVEPTIDPAEIGQLNATIGQLNATIGQLNATIEAQRRQLSQVMITDWEALMTALKAAGFNNWLAAAGASNPDLLDEIARLYAAAKSSDRVGVITEYLAIATEHPPTPDQLEAWQAVLDGFQPHPIPINLLWFVQPGASTGPTITIL